MCPIYSSSGAEKNQIPADVSAHHPAASPLVNVCAGQPPLCSLNLPPGARLPPASIAPRPAHRACIYLILVYYCIALVPVHKQKLISNILFSFAGGPIRFESVGGAGMINAAAIAMSEGT